VANVEIAIGLRWKTGHGVLVFAGAQVFGDDLPDEIKGSCFRCGFGAVRHDFFCPAFFLLYVFPPCQGEGSY
jgi:hypothetical protein